MSVRTEADVLAALARRYRGEDRGNGPAWAFVPHVRNAAGFNATRTIDAIAMSLWPSRGLELHGHEIKVSRSDWLRELKEPEKAEAFTQLVDRWWLVVNDQAIVKDGELPPTWGLMVATGRGVTVKVQAPKLHQEPAPMTRTFLAALLRGAARTASTTPEEITAAVAQAPKLWDDLHEENVERLREERDDLRERIRAFEKAAGVSLAGWRGDRDPAEVGAALRAILDGDESHARLLHRFVSLADFAQRIADDARRAAGSAA